mgnify:FL=1
MKLENLSGHLLKNRSKKVKDDFVAKLDHCIELIRTQPEIFPESIKGKQLRRCVITKQTTMYYRFNSKRINIVTLFDTRQDPNELQSQI